MGIGKIIMAVVQLCGWFFRWLGDPRRQARVDRAEVKEAAEQKEKDIATVQDAIRSGDADTVNRWIQAHTKIAVVLLSVSLLVCGCAKTRVVYVPESEKASPMVVNGVHGWFLPDSVFCGLIEKIERNPVSGTASLPDGLPERRLTPQDAKE